MGEVKRGVALLQDPLLNKGTAFSETERERFGLRGLLPPTQLSQEQQKSRILEDLRRKRTDLDRFVVLRDLQDRNERLFYRTLIDHLEELMPIVYTPTVGEACMQYAHIHRRPRGLYISAEDRGRVADVVVNWPADDVRIVVITDGQRILGLGDLGANGMGIPVGKLALYTACAGIAPDQCLPVVLDVGTDREELRSDPLYPGLVQPRVMGPAYDELVEEALTTIANTWPDAVIQFEDFASANAFRLLDRYRDRLRTFNDDIQGTAATSLAGLLGARPLTGRELTDHRILFVGAGSAGTGIAELIVQAMVAKGLELDEARRHCWFVDVNGLVRAGRDDLADFNLPFAHEHEPLGDLLSAVDALEPTALIGVSGQPQLFTEEVVGRMSVLNEHPMIFPLSNPTSCAECTAEQAYRWSEGRAVFASGSPFGPVDLGERHRVPGQANNVYIFPGLGLGAIASGTRSITDGMLLAAAEALAAQVGPARLGVGAVYPSLTKIREVSAAVAADVMRVAEREGLASAPVPPGAERDLLAGMYDPAY